MDAGPSYSGEAHLHQGHEGISPGTAPTAAGAVTAEASAACPGPGAGSRLAGLKRWLLWFLTFFGIYASSSVCPFCGTPGCPVGAGGAAAVGGFFALLWHSLRNWREKLTFRNSRS